MNKGFDQLQRSLASILLSNKTPLEKMEGIKNAVIVDFQNYLDANHRSIDKKEMEFLFGENKFGDMKSQIVRFTDQFDAWKQPTDSDVESLKMEMLKLKTEFGSYKEGIS